MEKNSIVKIINLKKLFRIMKLITVLMLIGALQISASSFSQGVKLSFSLKDTSIKEFFKQIEDQTDYSVFYKNETLDLSHKINMSVKEMALSDVLTKALSGQNISFKIIDKIIVVTASKSNPALTVTGIVTSEEDKMPIPGVTVSVKGTNNGTITDINGFYSIEIKLPTDILIFSFVGMQTQEVPVNGQTKIDVVLKTTSKNLEEVVVVGYSSQNKKLITGSIGSVNMGDSKMSSVQTIDGALQGKTAGVVINQNSGTPGGGISVRIRGNSSISAGSQPLYVIDGTPVTTGDYSQVSFSGQGTNAISDLNPNEIDLM